MTIFSVFERAGHKEQGLLPSLAPAPMDSLRDLCLLEVSRLLRLLDERVLLSAGWLKSALYRSPPFSRPVSLLDAIRGERPFAYYLHESLRVEARYRPELGSRYFDRSDAPGQIYQLRMTTALDRDRESLARGRSGFDPRSELGPPLLYSVRVPLLSCAYVPRGDPASDVWVEVCVRFGARGDPGLKICFAPADPLDSEPEWLRLWMPISPFASRPFTFVVFQLDPEWMPEEAAKLDYDQRDCPWE